MSAPTETPAYFLDRDDLRKAERLIAAGQPDAAWAVLRELLKRHPWKPKRVRKRRPRA